MAGPWEKYAPQSDVSGPWDNYKPQSPEVMADVFGSDAAAKHAITGDVIPDPNMNGEDFFMNPTTGQMTSRELLQNAQTEGLTRGDVMLRMTGHGASLGTSDEATWLGTLLGGGGFDGAKFAYENEKAKIGAMRQEFPGTSLASEMVGGLAVPASIMAESGKAVSLGKAAGQSAKSGAAIGGLYAAAEGDGVYDRFTQIPGGVAGGAIGGALAVPVGKAIVWAAGKFGKPLARLWSDKRYYSEVGGMTPAGRDAIEALGYNADEVSKAFNREFSKGIDEGLDPATSAAAAEMSEFGIPALKHNVTGDFTDAADFERARTGGVGPAAVVRKAQQLGAEQNEAMRLAPDALARNMSDGVAVDQIDAAIGVTGKMESVIAAEKAAAKAAYKAADEAGFTVPPEVAKGIHQRLQTKLAAEEIDLTSDLYSKARGYMARLGKRGDGSGNVSLRLIDTFRKDLNRTMARADSEDLRALTIIKREYDNWIDDVVDARLFDGSEDAIDSLKKARVLWSSYAKKYTGKDAGARFIRDMIDQDADPTKVATWLFGGAKMGNGRMTSKLAARLKEELGPDSSEWNMLRQAAFRKITQKPGTENVSDSMGAIPWGPQKVSENIFSFFKNPQSRLLANQLFTTTERAQMLRLASALKRTVPPKGSVNQSGSGYEVGRQAKKAAAAVMDTLTFMKGGPVAAGAVNLGRKAAVGGAGWLQAGRIGKIPKPAPIGLPAIGAIPGAQGATKALDLYQQGQGPR